MSTFKHSVRNLLLEIRELYCDLRIVAKDGSLSCHRVVIANACPLLRDVLKEGDVDEIIVPNYELNTVRLLVDLLYRGVVEEKFESDVLKLKDLLGVFGLKWNAFRQILVKEFSDDSDSVNDSDYNPHDDNETLMKVKNFDCQFCTQKFSNIPKLVEHINNHAKPPSKTRTQKTPKAKVTPKSTVIPFVPTVTCPLCDKPFKEHPPLLIHHAQEHKNMAATQCPVCSESVTKSDDLMQHVRSHKMGLKCPLCCEIYHYCGRLRCHVRSIHTKHISAKDIGIIVLNSKIDTSSQDMPLPNNLPNDDYTYTAERPYQCTYSNCMKWFSTRYYLRVHMRSHSGEKPYQCEVCAATFAEHARWKKHYVRMHTTERAYPCNLCTMAFVSKAELDHHSRVHTGIRKKQCEVCGRKFGNSSTLQLHMRTHTGERPYPCRMCSLRFKSSSQRKRHFRVHTGEKPYVCSICEKGFTINSNLKIHMKVHRPKGQRRN